MTGPSSENYNQKPSEENSKTAAEKFYSEKTEKRKNAMKKKEVLRKLAVKTVIALFASLMIVSNIAPKVCNAETIPVQNQTYTRFGRTTVNGKYRIGDADNDGYITSNDADLICEFCLRFDCGTFGNVWSPGARQFLLDYFMDPHSPGSVEYMDVNGDGKITPSDGSIIMRYLYESRNYAASQGEVVPYSYQDYCVKLK